MLIRLLVFAVAATLAGPVSAATEIHFPHHPDLSPDGAWVAFSWNGDLWRVKRDGGQVRRLTSHQADDSQPVFSPDGKRLAFISNRSGSDQVYVMPVRGGQPRQVTLHSEGFAVHGWFPDGKSLLCTGRRDHHWRDAERMLRVWTDGSRGEQVLADAAAEAPSLSPDGKRVLFNREGRRWWRKGYRGSASAQVWMLDLASGAYTKLLDEGVECLWPVWSPDGDAFYYARGGSEGFDLWRADLPEDSEAGGEEELKLATERVVDVDSHSVVFPTSARSEAAIVYRHGDSLYLWSTKLGDAPEELKLRLRNEADLPADLVRRQLERATEVAFQPDGLEIAFISGGDVWVMDTELREPVQVTRTPEHESDLAWGPDGESLWFVATKDTQADICRATRGDDEAYWWRNTEFTIEKITDTPSTESSLRFGPKGKVLLYRSGNGGLWSYDLESEDSTELVSGFSPPDFDLSPDGAWLAYAAEDDQFNSEIFLMPLDGSQPPYNVSRHPDNDSRPRFSNDGKVLAFTGNRFDQEQDIFYVYLQDQEDELSRRDRSLEKALKKMREERKESREKKDKEEEESEASSGEGNEEEEDDDKDDEPVVVDLEGIEDRVRRIRIADSDERSLVWVGKGQQLVFSATIKGESGLYSVELPDDKEPKRITSKRGSGIVWSAESKALFLNSDGRPTKITLKGDADSYGFSVVQEYSRRARFAHAFDVAWRTMRDRWYDERMGGKNWGQIRRRYRNMAANAIDSKTFDAVVDMMLGELNGSHLGFTPRDDDGYDLPAHADRTAHLGLRFEAGYQGPGLKVRDVLPGGPTDKHDIPIAAGDLLLKVDGVDLDPSFDLPRALNGLPRRDVTLTVQHAEGEPTQEYIVRPTSFAAVRGALYDKWLEDSRASVAEQSEGKLGYLHIRAMNADSFNEFERQLYAAGHGKSGLVIDVRDNGGGWTTDYLLTAITQPRHAITVPRGGGRGYPQDRMVFASWHKPIAVLCNQNSFSNAEIFSHAVKTLGRGKLIGVPTAGGVISTGSVAITDVGRMRMPFRGWFVLGSGEDMELNGAVPDEVLWPAPGELPAGVDRQLARAVEVLLEDVADEPAAVEIKYATERGE